MPVPTLSAAGRALAARLNVLPAVQTRAYAAAAAGSEPLLRTSLYDFHVKHGGKMVPFAGYDMPVQYAKLGVLQSHLHTRENASIFDVSHMLQTRVTGKDRVKFYEYLTVADIEGLPEGGSTLTVLVNDKGGIIDDMIVQKQKDHLFVVSNAGTRDKDLSHIRSQLKNFKGDVNVEVIDRSLIALQGPKAASVLGALVGSDLSDLSFMAGRDMDIKGMKVHVTRCGYTGEDGFEISVADDEAAALCDLLLANPAVELAGLGPRDSLRLEAGLCLYGHDIDDTTSLVEAGLLFTFAKRRRAEANFIGAETVLDHLKNGPSRKRVGLIIEGAPAREGAEILDKAGTVVGKVTSGGPSPSLKKNVAMGYVPTALSKNGTELQVKVRSKVQPAVVTKMPFVPSRYYRG
ncbi:glycine cleavage system protein T [Hyaloraphidium curvatum]|nr:glycine cleavage system protein T [Hyaloraphidium curvatum]